MAEDWSVNVKKYVPDADDSVIAGIVRYCGIALQKRDSSLVSFGDPTETGRVRENYLKKKLGLTHSDADLDTAIAGVGERMKGENFRNRVTVYYLLAEKFGKLGLFTKSGTVKVADAAPAASESSVAPLAAVGAAGAAGIAAAGAAASAVGDTVSKTASAAVDVAGDAVSAAGDAAGKIGGAALGVGALAAGAVGAAALGASNAVDGAAAKVGGIAAAAAAPLTGAFDDEERKGGWGWLPWLILGALALGLIWWLFNRKAEPAPDATTPVETVAPSDAAAAEASTAAVAAAPAEGTVAIPEGAGVTSETRDGKPVVKVYFDTAKTDVVPAFAPAAAGLKAYLDSHPDAKLEVSGFNDPRGNAAANEALSKGRAQEVQADLIEAGIAADKIAMVKPAASTDANASLAGARRVEVVVK